MQPSSQVYRKKNTCISKNKLKLSLGKPLLESFIFSIILFIFIFYLASFIFNFILLFFSCNFSSLLCLLLSSPPCFLSYHSLSFPSFCPNSFSVKSFSPSSQYVFYFIVFHACLSINSDIVDSFSHSMVEGAWQVLPKCSLRVDFLQMENS